MDVPLGVKTSLNVAGWEGHFVVNDITNTRTEPLFIYEYMMAREIINISDLWQRQKANKKNQQLQSFHSFLYGLFRSPHFNNEDKPLSDDQIMSAIQNRIQHGTLFDNGFRNEMVPRSQMLDYLASGDWKAKNFTQDDKIYIIRYENDGIPIIWIVISVNVKRGVVRLHVWSKSLVAYFLNLLGIRKKLPQYGNIGALFLGHVLHLLNPSIHTLYYTPYSRNSISAQSTTRVIEKLTKNPILLVDQESEEEVLNSLKEGLYVSIDDDMRNVYKNVTVREAPLGMCIQCGLEEGTHYTKQYGKNTPFCGKECLMEFLKQEK